MIHVWACKYKNMSVSITGHLGEWFWVFLLIELIWLSPIFLWFSVHSRHIIALDFFLLIKNLQWLKTKAWWKVTNGYDFFPHGDSRHYWYNICRHYWYNICKWKNQKFQKKIFLNFFTPRGFLVIPLYLGLGAKIQKSLWWPKKYSPYDLPCQISSLWHYWFGL